MTDIFFPDRSQFQGHTAATSLLVCARASEGNWLTDPDYLWNERAAKAEGSYLFAYHFLEDGSSASSQAAWCHAIAGPAPLMLDLEPVLGLGAAAPAAGPAGQGHYCGQAWKDLQVWGAGAGHAAGGADVADWAAGAAYVSRPSIALAEAFIDAYRKDGGTIHDLYLPRWYWQVLGSPSLAGLAGRGMFLTSSDYTAYSDSGPGWAPYGGMAPQVWQYTDTGPWAMDWNAFKGSAAATGEGTAAGELWSLLTTGSRSAPPPAPARQLVQFIPAAGESLRQVAAAHRGNTSAGILGHTIIHSPGELWNIHGLLAYVNTANWDAPLPPGVKLWLWA